VRAFFHLGDGFRRADCASDGYEMGRFSRRIVNREEFLKFRLIFREFIVVRIIRVLVINR